MMSTLDRFPHSPCNPLRIPLILILTLCFIMLTSSCGLGVRMRSMMGGKLVLKVDMSETANNNSPVALELVLIYDEALLKELMKISAGEWFEKKDQFQRDYPGDTGFDSWQWEWVPGQNVALIKLPLKARAKAGIVYVRYYGPGAFRARIDPHESIEIKLLEKEFIVKPLE
ncbi:MAG: hypothetical protein ABII26_07195 [Pseudomonadota bacterium]